ncbi:hypothetical protein GCM10009787_11170 [Streptomyces bangladeshensis]|uniref:Uncharacterized protein n=1 Tax=Streptomyces bangladeshensis TaxID=295352 RepID=A0ABN3BBR0_9ACTN
MSEIRPPQPAADPPARANLSPIQQAYSKYVGHAVGCQVCRSVDGEPCTEGEVLWEAYRQLRRGRQAPARF